MVVYGDRVDPEVCVVLQALQVGFTLLGDEAPAELASLASSDEEVAILLRRVGVQTNPGDIRPAPSLMAPILRIELRNETKEQLATLNWGRAEVCQEASKVPKQ